MTVSFESLFESIKLIAENVVKAIKFDETKFCTIVDDSDKKQGKYLVEEGDIQFEAISESQTFNKGDKVRVSFVMGDINNPKYIIGKAVDTESGDSIVEYVSPLDSVVDISGNLIDDSATYYPKGATSWSIMANGGVKDKLIISLDLSKTQELQNRNIYETIFMTAEFRSLMSEYRMTQGNYGIRIELFNEAGQRVGGDMIDSSEMFGSPYRFTIYTKQEKKGDIKNAGPISRIDVYLYQNNNFKYYNTTGGESDLNHEDFGDMDNIWVKNITLGFGSEVSSIEDNTLEIYSDESYTYNSDNPKESLNRNLRVIWYNKDKNNRYIGFGDAGKPEEENKAGYIKYSLDWYSYSPGNDKEEEGIPVVQDWKYEGSDGLPAIGLMKPEENDYQSVPLNEEIREDKFKAILRITERINDYNFIYNEESEDSEEDQKKAYDEEDKVKNIQYITVESNVLTFTNEATLIDTLAADANNGALYIEHGDFSQPGYSFYDEVNVIDKSYEALRERKLYVRFNGLSGKDDQIDGAIVYWYVPNTLTMLSFDEEKLTDIDETKGLGYQKLEETHPRYKENYTCYYKILSQFNSTGTDNIDATGGLVSRTFLYRVKDYYSESYKNNTILCEVDKGKITFKAEISFVFSTKGIAGTDYTLVVAPVGKQQAATEGSTFNLGISLYNPSGEIMKIDSEPELTWEGIYNGWSCAYSKTRDNILIYTITAPALSYGSGLPILKINVTAALDFPTEDEEVNASRKLDLITYYPMSYTNGEYYANSPNFITYRDNNINPSYQKDPYQLFNNTYTPLNATWEEFYFSYNTLASVEEEKPFLPSLTESNSLLPKNLYISNPTGYLVVWGKTEDSQVFWGQAIKILKNRYLSTTLNQWNGELVIDDDNNTILTAMVGAGQKNQDNSFSGVVMGEFGKLNDGTYATGLRGYHEGEKSFEFDINGTATLGKSGRGQIKFDGNKSTIQSASYAEGGAGMLFDLDNGYIDILGNDLAKIHINVEGKGIDNKPYFSITSPSNGANLIYITNDDGYYLQSENYKINEEGFELSEPIKSQVILEVTLEEVNSVVEVYVEEYRKAMREDLVGIITGDRSNRANCIKNYILNPNADKYNDYPAEKANLLKWGLTTEEIDKIATEYDGTSSDVANGILNTINSRTKEYGQGTKINLQNGIIDSYNLTLLTKYLLLDCKEEADPFFVLKDLNDKILMYSGIKTLDNTDSTIFYEVTKTGEQIGNPSNLFLKSPNYNLIIESKQDELKRIKHSGTFLDLNNGFFTTDHYYIAGKGILNSGEESYKLVLDSKSYADLLITYDEKDKPVIRIAADGQSNIGRFTVKNGVIESPSEQWYNGIEEERIEGVWGYYIPSALEKEVNITDKTLITDRDEIVNKEIWSDLIYQYSGLSLSASYFLYYAEKFLKEEISNFFFIPENYIFTEETIKVLNENERELVRIISGIYPEINTNFWNKIYNNQSSFWYYIPKTLFENYIKNSIIQVLYYYLTKDYYETFTFAEFLNLDLPQEELERVVRAILNSEENIENNRIAYAKFLSETTDFILPGDIDDPEQYEEIITALSNSEKINSFMNLGNNLEAIFSKAFTEVLESSKRKFTEGREQDDYDGEIDLYLEYNSMREICESRYSEKEKNNSGSVIEYRNSYSDALGREYAIAIGGNNAKVGKIVKNDIDFFPIETHNFRVTKDGRLFIGRYEITPVLINKLMTIATETEGFPNYNRYASWHTGNIKTTGGEGISVYPVNPEPQYILLTTLTGNDGFYNSSTKKGFWIEPRRSMKIEASAIRIGVSEVQVDLRLTYKILSSSSGSYTSYSQYYTPTINNIEQDKVKLKGKTPSNWYNSPIIKSSSYIINTSDAEISLSILFTSADTALTDGDITYTATLNVI